MAQIPVSSATTAFYVARGLVLRAYHRLTRANYTHGWLVRENDTPAGSFQCYEPLTRHGSDEMLAELDAACGPSDVIYDIGANIGIYALALTVDEPDRHCVAFEPVPKTADRLRANVRLNDLENRIDYRVCGLGDETSEQRFYRSSNPELSSFDRKSAQRWGATVSAVETVSSYRLDDLVAGVGEAVDDLEPPDVLKLDVEGTAPDVLRGARETLETAQPLVFIEIHEDGLKRDVPGETRGVLEEAGYDIIEREGYWRCLPGSL
ncbi:FkbM family methyltransferase [Natronolimnobius sp. AArcel1]|uniref:FkbM family methyltransferase n=1 Tax=Natronolimnobius sp. AArcel1 TaxID=1679093 RepID=UPI0013EA0926|nr:FkbM family methyltransferase [Natronolimnobius sp. AArcel1]NGM68827.1 FkbM family methyltransferase [Natronolimnobius sp. AArcel1]